MVFVSNVFDIWLKIRKFYQHHDSNVRGLLRVQDENVDLDHILEPLLNLIEKK